MSAWPRSVGAGKFIVLKAGEEYDAPVGKGILGRDRDIASILD